MSSETSARSKSSSDKKKAAEPNPYDLGASAKNRGTPVHRAPTGLTHEQLEAKLAEYMEVPRQYWDRLKRGDHVMYLRNEEAGGEMRAGGFVLLNPLTITDNATGEPIDMLKLQNRMAGKNPIVWSVPYRDIEKVYVRATVAELTIMARLREVEGGIKKLAAYAADNRASIDAAGLTVIKTAMKKITGAAARR